MLELNAALLQYADEHTSASSTVLDALEAETQQLFPDAHMLSGKQQGLLLQFISRMVKPKSILEIGTYTGYSAICLAVGLAEGGQLITLDKDESKRALIEKYIGLSGNNGKVNLIFGDAVQVIPTLNCKFDLVFIDANKKAYPTYFELALNQLEVGGWIIVDNVFFHGEVIAEQRGSIAQAIHEFNNRVREDDRVEQLFLPLRDGLFIIRKK